MIAVNKSDPYEEIKSTFRKGKHIGKYENINIFILFKLILKI